MSDAINEPPKTCPLCNGTGALAYDIAPDEDAAILCGKCDGTGVIKNVPTKGERLDEQGSV